MNNTNKNLKQTKSPETIVREFKEQFCKKLDAISYGSSHYEVFRSWAELAAITTHQCYYQLGILPKDSISFAMEARYSLLAAQHGIDILNEFVNLLEIVNGALGFQWIDFLGTIYTEMEISGKRSRQSPGEFFTPYPVAKLTAEMTLQNCKEIIERQGYITISEPACGAGGKLIALCEVIAEKGYKPRHVVVFDAVDTNPLYCHMAYIQLASLGLTGTVCHGDSIKPEIWERWETPLYQLRKPFHKLQKCNS